MQKNSCIAPEEGGETLVCEIALRLEFLVLHIVGVGNAFRQNGLGLHHWWNMRWLL